MKNELDRVQNEYLKLLQSISLRLEHEELLELLDEIQLFWYQKRNVVRMAAQYIFNYHDTYFLTAATKFDAEDSDQNVFYLNGKYQLFDDPIPSYLLITSKKEGQDGAFSGYIKKLSGIIVETILDEIKLLKSRDENLFILPLRYYLSLYSLTDSLDETAGELVNYFFKKPVNFLTLATIEDAEKIVDKKNMSNILLFDHDDFLLSISERIEMYATKNHEIVPKGLNDAQILYTALFSGIRQVLDIIETSIRFNVIPFFRSFTPFSKFSQILRIVIENSSEQKDSSQIIHLLNKATLEYLIYFEYSKINDGSQTISDLKEKSKEIDFTQRMQDIEVQMNNSDDFSVTAKKIGHIVHELLS